MDECIERKKLYNDLVLLAKYEMGERQQGILGCAETVRIFSAADVAPVVRCRDCEYSDDEISYLCCTHGVCADCEVPPNFYCAEGKRKDGDDDAKAD